jgi:Na+/proline symporter
VQRYLSTKDIRSARNSILTNAIIILPASLLFFGVGTALFIFYTINPEKLVPGIQNDAIFPLFIASELPIGISGLIVAGIFAAAQSTVSTSMNSISTVVVTDFVKRFSLLKTEKGYLNLARLLTLLSGAAGTVLALFFANANITSLWEQFMSILGLFGGSMCGLFMLGIFTKRTGGIAALCGAVISAFVLYWVKTFTDVNLILYGSIGIVVCVVSGYILSFVIPEKQKDITGLTISL